MKFKIWTVPKIDKLFHNSTQCLVCYSPVLYELNASYIMVARWLDCPLKIKVTDFYCVSLDNRTHSPKIVFLFVHTFLAFVRSSVTKQFKWHWNWTPMHQKSQQYSFNGVFHSIKIRFMAETEISIFQKIR